MHRDYLSEAKPTLCASVRTWVLRDAFGNLHIIRFAKNLLDVNVVTLYLLNSNNYVYRPEGAIA